MALRGNLRDFSLPDVFQLVTFSRKTGVLRIVREDEATGSVWFREGEVFFASSNWHADPLGQRLVNAQRITPQALKKALAIRAGEPADGRRLGQILVDEGYITDKVLESFVSEQIQDTIFDLMRWDDGDFDFEAMPEVVDEDLGLTVSIENVVMEGSRRLEEWSRIKKKIPSTDVVFKMATAPGEGTFEISLKPIEWQLLLLIDGTRSVADLAVETARTDFEVARIIYGLFSAGLLEFATDAEIKRNRDERAAREAKLAVIEEERRSAEEASRAAALEREASLAAAADKRRAESEDARPVAEAHVSDQAETSETEPGEEPEFLVGGAVAPTVEDQAALDEFMGAVLSAPEEVAPTTPLDEPVAEPAAPYVPGEEPAFISASGDVQGDEDVLDAPSVEELLGLAPLPESSDEPAPSEAPEPRAEAVVEPGEDRELAVDIAAPDSDYPSTPVEDIVEIDIDFERDLMALGLGELPSDLLTPMGQQPDVLVSELDRGKQPDVVVQPAAGEIEQADVDGILVSDDGEQGVAFIEPLDESVFVPEVPLDAEPVFRSLEDDEDIEPPSLPMTELPSWVDETADGSEPSFGDLEIIPGAGDFDPDDVEDESPVINISDDPMDFSALIESLDVDADEAGSLAASAAGFDAELLRDEAASLAGGVISTDAFLEDIGIEELGFSGGLNDELSALTGAQRRQTARPQASVNSIPDQGAGLLHRDARVDKDTLMKIIDGIKKL